MISKISIWETYQGLRAESLVPDNPGNFSLKDLCLSGLLDVVLAKSHSQAGNIITGHAVKQKLIVK